MGIPWFEPPEFEVAQPFWEGVEGHELRLPRCSSCRGWQWYPDEAGPDCAGARYEWVPVMTTGKLFSFTRVHRAFLPGGSGDVPFVVGLVELDGVEGVRFVAPVLDDERVAVGSLVAARFVEADGRCRPVFEVVDEEKP